MVTPEQIKALREARSWSQQELAAQLGVDQATISRLENGHTTADGPTGRLLRILITEPAQPAGEAA